MAGEEHMFTVALDAVSVCLTNDEWLPHDDESRILLVLSDVGSMVRRFGAILNAALISCLLND